MSLTRGPASGESRAAGTKKLKSYPRDQTSGRH
jgi:hypothetical protein